MHSCFVISSIGATGTDLRQDMDDLLDLIVRPALDCALEQLRQVNPAKAALTEAGLKK